MAIRAFCVCSLLLSAVFAFKDTSPVFIFSTSALPTLDTAQAQLAPSAEVSSRITTALRDCPSTSYIVVSQPGVSAADFGGRQAAPHLRRWVKREDERVASAAVVSDVIDGLDAEEVGRWLQTNCKATVMDLDAEGGYINLEDVHPRVIRIRLPALPRSFEERMTQLGRHDSYLNAVISALHEQQFTVIYTTTPPSETQREASHLREQTYEMDEPFPSVLHTELKRDVSGNGESGSDSDYSDVPLFEKYQFLSPAIFMGFLVAALLLSILYVGMNALAGLEVSYGAFTKDMGPTAQKKQ